MLVAAHHSLHTSSFSEERFITFLDILLWSKYERFPSSILLIVHLETSTSLDFHPSNSDPSGEIHDVVQLSRAEDCWGSVARRRGENERPSTGWWWGLTGVIDHRSSHCCCRSEADQEFHNVRRHFWICCFVLKEMSAFADCAADSSLSNINSHLFHVSVFIESWNKKSVR